MSEPTPQRSQLRVGRLTKAHGLKGALKLELFTDDPGRRFVPGAVFTLQVPTSSPWHGKTLELVELRMYNQHPVGFFKDVPDREAAETLVKAILWIDQDDDEQSTEEDAWYDHQLVGLSVVRDGVEVGTIARLEHLPAQDLLIVKTASGEVMVPFVKAIVPSVDVKAGVVTVTPPVGLFEELPADEDDVSAVDAANSAEVDEVAAGADAEGDAVETDATASAADMESTDAPAKDAPATDAPATDAPATDVPAKDAPATDAPATGAPATDAPATDAPEAGATREGA